MIQGLGVSRNESLKLEEKAFTELLNSDVASNLVNIFFLQERSKKTKSDKDFKVNKTAVIGAVLWVQVSHNGLVHVELKYC